MLKGKVVLVTGGPGRAMSERFLGLDAIISGRREAVLQTTAEELGGELVVPRDVREPAQVAAPIDAAEAHFGQVDVLVNYTAGDFIAPTERWSVRAINVVLSVLSCGTFYCALELTNLASYLILDAAAFIFGDLIAVVGNEFSIRDEVTPE